MPFVTEEDYKSQIRDFDLDDLTDYTEAVRLDAELRAQAQMEDYLRDRFDVGVMFEQTGNDRNPMLVMYMIDISLYHLFCMITPRNVPDVRKDRYDGAVRWLEKVRKGELNPNLPENKNERGDIVTDSKFGSNIQNGYNW